MNRFAPLVLAACTSTELGPAHATQSAAYPVHAELGVVENAGRLYVFDGDVATVVRGGETLRLVKPPPGATWASPTVIPAPGGEDRWVVAIANGELIRITADGELERVGAHLDVADHTVLAIAGMGQAFAAGLADGALATTDGRQMKHFEVGATPLVAAARSKVAVARASTIDVFDLEHASATKFSVASVERIGFLDADSRRPRLVAMGAAGVYLETSGRLQQVQTPGIVRNLAISGPYLWLVIADTIYIHDGRKLRRTGLSTSPTARIFGSPSGDVWLAGKRLLRFSLDGPRDTEGRMTQRIDGITGARHAPRSSSVSSSNDRCHRQTRHSRHPRTGAFSKPG